MSIDSRKVVVVGCGFVGSSSAFALMQSKLFSEMVLIDADHDRAEGEAMDISHGMAFASPMKIYAGSYDDITDAAVIVITAGANQKPDETRLDLIRKNSAIMKSIIGEIKKRPFEGILLIVSNPVDILTYIALKESGYPANRVQERYWIPAGSGMNWENIWKWIAEVFMLLLSANMETANWQPGARRESVACLSTISVNCGDIMTMSHPWRKYLTV